MLTRREILSGAGAVAGNGLLSFPAFADSRPVSHPDVEITIGARDREQELGSKIWVIPELMGDLPEEKIHLKLSLCIDASSSIKSNEFLMQLVGTADALICDSVVSAVENKGGICLSVNQFAGIAHQSVGWGFVHSRQGLQTYRDILLANGRMLSGSTGIVFGIDKAVYTKKYIGISSHNNVIDVSGDGENSVRGPLTRSVKTATMQAAKEVAATVNGLPIIADDNKIDIVNYYKKGVITDEETFNATGAREGFIEVAEGFESFQKAMERKLFNEIAGIDPATGHQHEDGYRPMLARRHLVRGWAPA